MNGVGKLVSVEFVDNSLRDGSSDICVLDTAYLGGKATELYEAEHIQGAQHFLISSVIESTEHEERMLVHPLVFQSYVRELGVNNDTHVVLYDHGEALDAVKTAAFVWWTFKVFGHEKVSIMHGGLKAWKADSSVGTPLTTGPSETRKSGNFVARWCPEYRIEYDDVIERLSARKCLLIDTRIAEEFSGQEKTSKSVKFGAIKGSVGFPTISVLNQKGEFKSENELKECFMNLGLSATESSILSCNTGLQASAVLFCALCLGLRSVLYTGGWVEWSKRAPEDLVLKGNGGE